ncbi:hypothetical protein [Parapedobacter sp. DT-150]
MDFLQLVNDLWTSATQMGAQPLDLDQLINLLEDDGPRTPKCPYEPF